MEIEDLLAPIRVGLYHVDIQGNRQFLGVFIEEPSPQGRHLTLAPMETLYDRWENVHGDYWLGLAPPPKPEDHPEEVIRLKKRFLELLEESQCLV